MKNTGKRFTVRKHAMCDFMIYDRKRGYCFGSFGLREQAQTKADELNKESK